MLLDLRSLITTTLVNSVFKDDISCLELGIQTSSKFLCKVFRDHTHEDQKKVCFHSRSYERTNDENT